MIFLYGPPGSGKTSTIVSLANQYSMDFCIIFMDQIINVSTIQKLFKGINKSKGFIFSVLKILGPSLAN